ncbi:hypothetical protein MAUB1S_10581 [Mycolicibacterium aubagnense]
MATPSVTFSNPTAGLLQIRLSGFGVGSAALTPEHQRVLRDRVVPVIAAGGSITVAGHASRSGSDTRNSALSLQRANAVVQHIKKEVRSQVRPTAFDVKSVTGNGEQAAATAGVRDGTEDPHYRAVTLAVWAKPVPPKIPTVVRTAPKLVSRTVKLTKSKIDTTGSSGAGADRFSGEDGAAWASLIAQVFFDDFNTIKNVETDSFPSDYVITEIRQDYSYEHDRRELASFSSERVVVSFKWGPSTPSVTYIRRGRMLSTTGRKILKDTGWETDKRVTIPRGELLSKLKAMGSR